MHFSRFSRLAEELILVMMVREIDLIYVNKCIQAAVQILAGATEECWLFWAINAGDKFYQVTVEDQRSVDSPAASQGLW